MKRVTLTIIALWATMAAWSENINFADSNVKALCVDNWDTNSDGELSEAEAAAVTDLGTVFQGKTSIASFDELQYFTGLEIIQMDAFSRCSGLTSIVIPNSVTSIGSYAFLACSSLTSITIPNSVTEIGFYTFASCSSLTSVTIGTGLTSIDNYAFSNCTSLTSIEIPNGMTSLKLCAFDGCSGLTSIEIPNSVTSIGEYAFRGCYGLTSVTIGNSVTSIGEYAFSACYVERDKYVNNSSLNAESFNYWGCNILDSRENGFCVKDGVLVKYTGSDSSITIPNNVIEIGNAFSFVYTYLTAVSIPNSVTKIGQLAFASCSGLTSIEIPNSVTTIDQDAFYNCSGLTSITIPASVTSIGNWAFRCSNLTSVTVESTLPVSIYAPTFSNRSNATLYVPVGCKTAYESAEGWKDFKDIIEIREDITIGSAGMGTFCCTHPLDFSGTNDIKAYIVSAFKPSTGEVTLTRITDVPANTGIVVKGDAGTYTIPWGAGETVVANMLVGVTENTVLNKVDGDCTNYVLAKKDGSLGFYAVVGGSTLSAGKAYLPLPTAQLPSAARPMRMVFSDDEATGIEQTVSNNVHNSEYYDLQGRRVAKPAHGLYIVNGKKVILK